MTISVIIPTFNGAHKIKRILQSLEQQTTPASEVIVVIDGSTDGTKEYLEAQSFNLSCFKIIDQENGGRAKVRNRGAKEASGDIIIFFDDDMLARPDCIEIHYRHHSVHTSSLLSGSAVDDHSQKQGDFLRFKEQVSQRWESELKEKEHCPLNENEIFLTAANFSLPRQVFDKLGGFNSALNDGEDFDLAFRAFKEGYSVYYSSLAQALHLDETSCCQFIRRGRSYYQAGMELAQLNPDLYYERFRHRLSQTKTAKHFFYRLFCSKWWIQSIDANHWIGLPKFLRYKLYDIVVTANISYYPEAVKL